MHLANWDGGGGGGRLTARSLDSFGEILREGEILVGRLKSLTRVIASDFVPFAARRIC